MLSLTTTLHTMFCQYPWEICLFLNRNRGVSCGSGVQGMGQRGGGGHTGMREGGGNGSLGG